MAVHDAVQSIPGADDMGHTTRAARVDRQVRHPAPGIRSLMIAALGLGFMAGASHLILSARDPGIVAKAMSSTPMAPKIVAPEVFSRTVVSSTILSSDVETLAADYDPILDPSFSFRSMSPGFVAPGRYDPLMDPRALGPEPRPIGQSRRLQASLAPVLARPMVFASLPAPAAEVERVEAAPVIAVPVPRAEIVPDVPLPAPRPAGVGIADAPDAGPVAPARPVLVVPQRSRRTKLASLGPSSEDTPTFFQRFFGTRGTTGPALASGTSGDEPAAPTRKSALASIFSSSPAVPSAGTAIYDISARTVILPSGEKLEAHSGLGDKMDDPRHVDVRMRGATPPHVYDLTEREQLFHGVQAIRLNPVGGSDAIHGREGLLAHSYMLGPRGDSNGCISFKNYDRFLQAYRRGDIKRLVVVANAN